MDLFKTTRDIGASFFNVQLCSKAKSIYAAAGCWIDVQVKMLALRKGAIEAFEWEKIYFKLEGDDPSASNGVQTSIDPATDLKC